MTGAFDGSAYRKEVLALLRDRDPSQVEDLFWLGHVPRELDDDGAIRARLTDARGFLNKELSRARQAAVASAVLKEWPRVEAGLTDAGARRALRTRLASAPDPATAAPPGAGAGGSAAPRRRPAAAAAQADPAARRRRQVAANLRELARLRGEPELAADLFALLGLPVTATTAVIEERLARIGEVNRRRRADRERSLTDELLAQARELLVAGDPSAYLAGLAGDAAGGVVDALLAGDADGAREALAVAREAGVTDATILATLAPAAKDAGGAVPVSAIGLGTWCPACGTVNAGAAPGAPCTSCGGALTVTCDACRAVAAADLERCPSCTARLDDAREPLLAARAERTAELAALAEVDAAPEAERPARLAALAAAHPGWTLVGRRAAAAPPRPVAWVTVTRAGEEATVTWAASDEPGVTAYLVERTDPGAAARVLGRTGLTEWTDRAPDAGPVWSVRALRGETASAPTTSAADPAAPGAGSSPPAAGGPAAAPEKGGLSELRAEAGPPIVLRWEAPAGAAVELRRIERRPEGDIERRITPDPGGYEDRKVARGRTYEYHVSVAGSGAAPAVLTVVAGGGETAPSPPSPPPPPSPAPTREEPPGDAGAAIADVRAARDPDGRLRVTFTWPAGTTEAFVAHDAAGPPQTAGGSGRKVTNMRYELDGGALLDGVPAGAHLAVFAGARDARGILSYAAAPAAARTTAP